MNLPSGFELNEELTGIAAEAGEPLSAVIGYALEGGKRCRAQLLLDMGQKCGLPEGSLWQAAALVELLHAATLLQDDLFDGSRKRRGRPASWVRFSPQAATLAADWMLAEAIRRSYRLSASFGDALCRCAQQLISGEAREALLPPRRSRAALAEHALSVARAKTGELFALALSAPFLLAGEPAQAQRFASAGRELGVAFQYIDDVLDLVGDAAAAGKELGRDRDLRLVTMPLLDLWTSLPGPVHESLLKPTAGSADLIQSAFAEPALRERLLHCAHDRWNSALDQAVRLLPVGVQLPAMPAALRRRCAVCSLTFS